MQTGTLAAANLAAETIAPGLLNSPNQTSSIPLIMSSETLSKTLASTIITGFLGAGLIYFGRRNKGILAALGETAGYSLLTKAVSSAVIAALEPPQD